LLPFEMAQAAGAKLTGEPGFASKLSAISSELSDKSDLSNKRDFNSPGVKSPA
jgi:hypothetical protein